ncbi:chloride channel protein [Aestuariirhabdus litorea]|uniref:Chloride channel protein n=1 Tax=Aestuariirhabdus litorea TaxID=2528527 RepID=A0A3P3VL53_9GAMM|nr:chloride channel protein [Aestuariirhabdus litorea]RRJ83455.1 chloride channel protein [Aestuariirhabdus litorea]RWW93617.1 chloride channel protein [Endozoicomonadaceae bacterium GTF-13]
MRRPSPPQIMNQFRLRLANAEAVPQLALLGILSGLITGAVIILFRQLLGWMLGTGLPEGNDENFEGLADHWRLLLPIAGSLVLVLLFALIAPRHRQTGIAHVIERMALHQGHLPFKNMLVQFVGALIALASGHSSGREGPAVHLGAAGSSGLGHWLRLPNNSVRTLVGCGSAAAISAAFNTPIAGVIFAMEVVMMEYTISGFIPVILASVIAAFMTALVYGSEHAFVIPLIEMRTLLEFPLVILCGLAIGCLAASFIWLSKQINRRAPSPYWFRLPLAGVLTGLVALQFPQVMGIGYDTISDILFNTVGLEFLLLLVLAKLLVSAAACGLGVPAGTIGPSLFLGACLGGAIGLISQILYSGPSSGSGFYAMLGMGAMMAAVLQAPLAALMAVMELTHNPNIILPAMLAVVIASLTSRYLLGQGSLFAELLGREMADPRSLLEQGLHREGVANIMDGGLVHLPRQCPLALAQELLRDAHKWVVVVEEESPRWIFRADELRLQMTEPDRPEALDLLSIPALRKDIAPISDQATVQEALQALHDAGTEALYVRDRKSNRAIGIVTQEFIQQHYRLYQ